MTKSEIEPEELEIALKRLYRLSYDDYTQHIISPLNMWNTATAA